MPAPKKMKRDEFIKRSLLSGAAIYLNSCGSGNNKSGINKIITKDSIVKDTISAKLVQSEVEPTFKLYKKGDEQYDILRKGFNKRIDHFPAAIAECTSEEEVSQAMAYAIKNNLPVSVKSGGHSFEGFSSNDNSLLINLSSMKEIQWENENTISVGPGCRLSRIV